MTLEELNPPHLFLFPSCTFCVRSGWGLPALPYRLSEKSCGNGASRCGFSCRQFGRISSLIHDDNRDPGANMQNKFWKEGPNKGQCVVFTWNTVLGTSQFSDVFTETVAAARILFTGHARACSCLESVQRSPCHSVPLNTLLNPLPLWAFQQPRSTGKKGSQKANFKVMRSSCHGNRPLNFYAQLFLMEACANPVRAEEKRCVDYLACHRLLDLKLARTQWTQGGKAIKELSGKEWCAQSIGYQLWLGAGAVVTCSSVTLFHCWSPSTVMSVTTRPSCKVPHGR